MEEEKLINKQKIMIPNSSIKKISVFPSGNIITISGLNAGNYTLKVTTKSDADHNSVTKTANIIVNKVNSSLV